TSSQGAHTIPEDGESLFSLAVDRIVTRFRKPILQAAGNFYYPGMEQATGEAAAEKVLGIGGYNQGSSRNVIHPWNQFPAARDYVGELSPHGPNSIGGLKPDLLAPNTEVAARPCAVESAGSVGEDVISTFRLPRCYYVGGGTSSAAPFAAGAIALLISAAKQSGVSYDVDAIYWALRMSARRLSGYGAYQQGSGLIQVDEAWKLLKEYKKRPAVNLDFAAPINTPLS